MQISDLKVLTVRLKLKRTELPDAVRCIFGKRYGPKSRNASALAHSPVFVIDIVS